MTTRHWILVAGRAVAALAYGVTLALAAHAAAERPDADSLLARLASVKNVARPYPWLLTGGQPDSSALATLAAAGVRDIVDLRAPGEPRGLDERALAKAMGLRYLAIPTRNADFTDSRFTALRKQLIAHGPRKPVFIHCASGNRVGAGLLPWLVLDEGVADDRALAMARNVGLRDADITQRAWDYIERARGRVR